jgi:hypothetical protein
MGWNRAWRQRLERWRIILFIDGLRCAQGLPQTQFFAKPLPEPTVDEDAGPDAPDDEDEDEWDEEEEDEDAVPMAAHDDRGRRLEAIQKRAERFTAGGMALLLHAVGEISQTLVDMWAAYGRFCRTRLGVEPETMLRAWQFPLAEFQETLERYEKVRPDEKKVAEYTGYITRQWDRRFRERVPGSEYVRYADDEGDGDAD